MSAKQRRFRDRGGNFRKAAGLTLIGAMLVAMTLVSLGDATTTASPSAQHQARLDANRLAARAQLPDQRSLPKASPGGKAGAPSGVGAAAPSLKTKAAAALRARVLKALPKLPLAFEPNRGQTVKSVKFVARAAGYSMYLDPASMVLVLTVPGPSPAAGGPASAANSARALASATNLHDYQTSAVRMKFLGANPAVEITGENKLRGISNYFIGNDPKQWHTHIPNFAKVRYRGLYPGVDLVYYGVQGELENDLLVAPGADPRAIRLGFEGANKLELDAAGNVVLETAAGKLTLRKPVVYQLVGGVKRPVQGRFVLLDVKGPKAGGRTQAVGFTLASYDKRKPLVIDPIIALSTYFGGSVLTTARGIALDGNSPPFVYIAGTTGHLTTSSTDDLPTTLGAQPYGLGKIPTPTTNAFVTQLTPDLSALVFSTYLGGSTADFGNGIALQQPSTLLAPDVYVVGTTQSTDFPATAGAFQTTSSGPSQAFVARFDNSGNLLDATFFGGSTSDSGNGVALDSANDVYIVGTTSSLDSPVASDGGLQSSYGGGSSDAFVAQLSSDLSMNPFGTFVGGSEADSGSAIAIDSSRNVDITGSTASTDLDVVPFPTCAKVTCVGGTAFQTTYGGGASDAFVTTMTADLTTNYIFSTYVGGGGTDVGNGIATDSLNDVYITGGTTSASPTAFPTFSPLFIPVKLNGPSDAFVTAFGPSGGTPFFSTYLGGSGDETGNAIAVDSAFNIYVTGSTTSTDFPLAAPTQAVRGGKTDVFMTRIDSSLALPLDFSTYLGGNGNDIGFGLALDPAGDPFVTGSTNSTNFVTTPGVIQHLLKGPLTTDSFVTVFGFVSATPSTLLFGSQAITSSSTKTVTLSNNTVVTITGITLSGLPSGPFTIMSNGCSGGTLAPASTCDIVVKFLPTSIASFSAKLMISYSGATGSPLTVSMNGSGAPAVTLSTLNLGFAAQAVGTPSDQCVPRFWKGVTLTNHLTTPIGITSTPITGTSVADYALFDPALLPPPPTPPAAALSPVPPGPKCASSVPGSGSCVVYVDFKPVAVGAPLPAKLTINLAAPGTTQIVTLTGSGVARVTVSPTSIDFGPLHGGVTASKNVKFTNNQCTPLSFSSIFVNEPLLPVFGETTTCPVNSPFTPCSVATGNCLARTTSCTTSATYTAPRPPASGPFSGSLEFMDDAGTQLVPLKGTTH